MSCEFIKKKTFKLCDHFVHNNLYAIEMSVVDGLSACLMSTNALSASGRSLGAVVANGNRMMNRV